MTALVALGVAVPSAAYAAAVHRLAGSGRRWPRTRSLAAAGAALAVAAALTGPVAAHDERFGVHVGQHLLLGMLAPLLLALAAPITLALRAVPPARRPLLRLLRSRPVRLLVRPELAGALAVGGLYLLYLTPLYRRTLASPALHVLVHLHLLVAGTLLAVATVGRDPLPHRASPRTRGSVVVLAAGAHAVLAKLLYARGGPLGVPPAEGRAGAVLMYYGGDVLELATAVALLLPAYRRGGRRLPGDATRRAGLTAAGAPPGAAHRG